MLAILIFLDRRLQGNIENPDYISVAANSCGIGCHPWKSHKGFKRPGDCSADNVRQKINFAAIRQCRKR